MSIELVDEGSKEERMLFLERQMVKVVLMCEKEYYYYDNSEFMSGLGVIYTEFTGQRASRQINVLNGYSYASSCLQDYVPEVGFLLYDGRKDELDLSDSIKISQEEFERIWAQAVASGQNDT